MKTEPELCSEEFEAVCVPLSGAKLTAEKTGKVFGRQLSFTCQLSITRGGQNLGRISAFNLFLGARHRKIFSRPEPIFGRPERKSRKKTIFDKKRAFAARAFGCLNYLSIVAEWD